MGFTPIILVHVVTALGALVFGGVALAARKGSPVHRISGRVWVVLMLTTAMVSFGITREGGLSAIHLLSVITLVGVSAAIYAAKQGRIKAHRHGMTATYVSLAVAGVFTLVPGRRLGDMVWQAVGLI